MFPDSRTPDLLRHGLGHRLGVRADLTHGPQVRVLLLDPQLSALLLALLPPPLLLLALALLVFKGAANGPSVGILFSDLEDPLCSPHCNVLAHSALHSGLVGAWKLGKYRNCDYAIPRQFMKIGRNFLLIRNQGYIKASFYLVS